MINTVSGPISAEELGVTLMHEHVLWGFPGWEYDPLHSFNREAELPGLARELAALKTVGAGTLVDTTPPFMGRDPVFLQEISRLSGIKIIACTGFYSEEWGGIPFYFHTWNPDELAELMTEELNRGMGGTAIKAGVIKVGTGGGAITPGERNILVAAARAHLKTGVPIMTHTHLGANVKEQLDVFQEEKVNLSQVVIGHLSDTMNFDLHLDVARRGAIVGLDRLGLEGFHSNKEHVQLVAALIAGGYLRQLVFSQDVVGYNLGRFPFPIRLAKVELKRPYDHLWRKFFPLLEEAGIGQETITTIMKENPRRIFQPS
ncbi:MAG: hypothetical protein PHU08_05260 [Dehalococcoidales bacterium]|nr:hypothetical protein [Dehalococcoidales bacterium]